MLPRQFKTSMAIIGQILRKVIENVDVGLLKKKKRSGAPGLIGNTFCA